MVITAGDRETSYSEVLAWARHTVKLSEEEMKALTTKRSATGGILLEIRGEKNKEIAERLTIALRTALCKFPSVKVHMPKQMAEITLVGLDISVTREEIKQVMAKEGGCSLEDISVGNIRTSPRGVGFVWTRCPLAVANLLERQKRIKIGWSSVKVNLLPPRRIQCFRCLRTGHTKACCNERTDRSDLCYNCGQKGHKSTLCKEKTRCILCEEAGVASNYRIGGPKCFAPPSKGRINTYSRPPNKSPMRAGGKGTTEGNIDMQEKSSSVNDRSPDTEGPENMDMDPSNMETEEITMSEANENHIEKHGG